MTFGISYILLYGKLSIISANTFISVSMSLLQANVMCKWKDSNTYVETSYCLIVDRLPFYCTYDVM